MTIIGLVIAIAYGIAAIAIVLAITACWLGIHPS